MNNFISAPSTFCNLNFLLTHCFSKEEEENALHKSVREKPFDIERTYEDIYFCLSGNFPLSAESARLINCLVKRGCSAEHGSSSTNENKLQVIR